MNEENQYFLEYLEEHNFQKHLEKISIKLKNKRVMIYGAGTLFEILNSAYDLSRLNIIAISDRKFENFKEGEKFLGYTVCAPDDIIGFNPDYILVSTIKFFNVQEFLVYELLKTTKIKVQPLVKFSFIEVIKEIWST